MDEDGRPDLFGYAARQADARAARDEGMARVEEHAEPGWNDTMYALVEEIVRRQVTFTSDDVFDLAELRGVAHGTHDRRAFGPVMMRAARDGLCRKANVAAQPSRRASLHASPRAVWVSLWKSA
jgi:hypothetical protein